jgi:hypothetical protein
MKQKSWDVTVLSYRGWRVGRAIFCISIIRFCQSQRGQAVNRKNAGLYYWMIAFNLCRAYRHHEPGSRVAKFLGGISDV